MSWVILDIDVDTALADAWFEYAGYHIRDAREPLRRSMLEVVFPAIREQLDTSGAHAGTPYEPLADEYGAWKELAYPGEPILRLTHDMERALFDPLSYRVTRDLLEYRPRDFKVAYHQEGREAGAKGGYMPARPPVALSVGDVEEIETIFTDWLDELRVTNRRRGSDTFGAIPPNINILGGY